LEIALRKSRLSDHRGERTWSDFIAHTMRHHNDDTNFPVYDAAINRMRARSPTVQN